MFANRAVFLYREHANLQARWARKGASMSTKAFLVNERIRLRVREIRLHRQVTMTDLAARMGMPISSYASMETGKCRISLDHLYGILGALDTDINDVWPALNAAGCQSRLYLRRRQEFRLNELIVLSGAEGGAIFHLQGARCQVLFHEQLSDFLIDRLLLSLESGREYGAGNWMSREDGPDTVHLFLKAEHGLPEYITRLAEKYLTLWSRLIRQGGLLEGEKGPNRD